MEYAEHEEEENDDAWEDADSNGVAGEPGSGAPGPSRGDATGDEIDTSK